jgi:hypothetical protein
MEGCHDETLLAQKLDEKRFRAVPRRKLLHASPNDLPGTVPPDWIAG